MKQIGIFMTIPFVLALPPLLGWYVGSWLDEKLGSTPYLMYLLIILGLVAGFREVFHLIKRFSNEL